MKDIYGQEYQYDSDKGFSNLVYEGGNAWDSLREPPKEPDEPDRQSESPAPDTSHPEKPVPSPDKPVTKPDKPSIKPPVASPSSEQKLNPQPTPEAKTQQDNLPSFGDIYTRLHANEPFERTRPKPEDVPPAKNPEKLTRFASMEELREQLQNPLDDPICLQEAIDAYSGGSGYYNNLQRVGIEQKVSGYFDREARNQFEQEMFARWRKNIEALTDDEIDDELKKGHKYYENYRNLRDLMLRYKDRDIKTRDDLIKNLRADFKDDDEKVGPWLDVIDSYCFAYNDNWEHIKSRYVNLRREARQDTKHRFYLNTDSTFTDTMINELVKGFEDAKMPYYFKYDFVGDRRDTIVVYTSEDGAVDTLNVIQDIIEKRPDLAEHLRTPPVLTAKIDGVIGYGAEPSEQNGKKESYSSVRAKLLEKAINEVSDDWFRQHWNDSYEINGVNMSISEHCAYMAVDKKVGIEERWFRSLAAKKSEAEAEQQCGFKLKDMLPGGKYFAEIENGVRSHRKGMGGDKFEVRFNDKKWTTVYEYYYADARHALVKDISRLDPDFNAKVRSRVDQLASQYGVDANKFCFDLPAAQQLAAA